MKPGPKPTSDEERFWGRVEKRSPDECWEWWGYLANHGYGRVNLRESGKPRKQYAHRFSYELHNGPIPEGMCVCHKCDNPSCVNPAHLFLGTQADNLRDMTEKGRRTSGENHPNSKLSFVDVLAIRGSALPGKALADCYGVSAATITLIKQRKRWAHLS